MPPTTDDDGNEPSGGRFVAAPALLRAAVRASDPRRIVLAALGLLLLWGGWSVIDRGGLGPSPLRGTAPPTLDLGSTPVARVADTRLVDRPWEPLGLAATVAEPAVVVVEPFVHLFRRRTDAGTWFLWLLRGVWAVVVWSLVGGAIARVALVREAVGGGVGIASAGRFALGRAVALVGAPLTPFLAVAVLAASLAVFGLLFRLPVGVGGVLVGLLGFVPLLLGLVMTLILLGLALGWPLMVTTVAAEGEDLADALSRSYSYVNQRLARYLIHLGLAWVLGTVALMLAIGFACVVLGLADWGVALGAPGQPSGPPTDHFRGFWSGVVGWLVHAYAYSYFWTVLATLYVVLRRDVDGTDPHDVWLPEQAADLFAGPPPPPVAGGGTEATDPS